MTLNSTLVELNRRLPYLMATYGGVENFVIYLKTSLTLDLTSSFDSYEDYEKQKMLSYLLILLQNYDDTILISPWNMYLDLKVLDGNDIPLLESINIDEPYRVYKDNGDLVYSVVDHNGIFGESKLDKYLLINSVNTSLYYLKYKTLTGREKIKVLLVNIHSINTEVSNNYYEPVINNSEESTITVINKLGIPINIYIVASPPNISSNFNFVQNDYAVLIKNNDAKVLNVSEGLYIYIDNPSIIFEKTKISYSKNDAVVLNAHNKTSLVYVGYGVDPSMINRTFNKSISFTNKPFHDVITLKSDIF